MFPKLKQMLSHPNKNPMEDAINAILSSLMVFLYQVAYSTEGGVAEKGGVATVKGGVVAKAAPIEHGGGTLALAEHLVGQKKAFFHDIFFRSLVQFLFEQTEKVAFADKQMIRHLAHVRKSAKIFVHITEGLGNQRRQNFPVLGAGLGKKVDVVKQHGKKVREDYAADSRSIKEYTDPFTGSKNN